MWRCENCPESINKAINEARRSGKTVHQMMHTMCLFRTKCPDVLRHYAPFIVQRETMLATPLNLKPVSKTSVLSLANAILDGDELAAAIARDADGETIAIFFDLDSKDPFIGALLRTSDIEWARTTQGWQPVDFLAKWHRFRTDWGTKTSSAAFRATVTGK